MAFRVTAGRKLSMNGKRVFAVALAAIGVGGVVLAGTAALAAPPISPPVFIDANVATCADAGLSGSILFGSGSGGNASDTEGSGTVTGDFLDVHINAGWTASGIVVKGGPKANVYHGPYVGPVDIDDMVSPEHPKPGAIPEISHWFVCGGETPPDGSTPPPDGTTPPPDGTTPPPDGTTPAPSSSEPEMPVTGAAIGGIVATGLVLVVGGAALIVAMMARRRRDATAAE